MIILPYIWKVPNFYSMQLPRCVPVGPPPTSTPINSVSGPALLWYKKPLQETTRIIDFYIEVLNVMVVVFQAIILLLHQTPVKVLKDALAHLGPYQTLTGIWCIDPGGENTVSLPATIQI
jgi:hypothetical protein